MLRTLSCSNTGLGIERLRGTLRDGPPGSPPAVPDRSAATRLRCADTSGLCSV